MTSSGEAVFEQRDVYRAKRGGKVGLECLRYLCRCELIFFAEFKLFLCLKVKSKRFKAKNFR